MKRQPRIPVLVLALALLVLAGIFGVRWLFPKHIAAPAASSSAAASANVETPPTPSSGNKYPRNEPKAPRRLASGTAENDAALTSGAFEGRVVSWSTGKGVAGATITFVHAGVTASVTAGEGGNFRFVPSESGLYDIAIVAAEGYLPFAPAIDQSPLALTARPGERIRDILLYLTPAIQYAGIVLGPSKEPVAGAEVRLFSEDGGDVKIAPLPDRFTTDAKGEFRFSAPDYALLLATHPDYAPGRARIDLSAQTSRRVALRLKPSTENAPRAVIAGRVVDSKGAPVEGATVIARSTKALPPAFERDIRPDPSATSDDEGNFEIETTAGDRYHVTASRRGLAPGEALDIPSDTRDLTLTLSRGASLRGIVRDKATGAPVVAFTVNVLKIVGPIERREYQVASFFDAQGRYEITGLGPGSFSVIAAAHGYAASDEIPFSIQSDPPADPAPIDIPLGRGGRLTGSVVEENTNTNTNTNTKKPIAGARVSLEGRSNQSAGSAPLLVSTTTGEDGRFELSGLSAGLRSITVVAEGHHGRIVSGLAVAEGGDIGPITVELAKTEEGEEPRLELTGIGAVLSIKDDGLILGQVFPGGGAAEAGLQPGDIILRIDGLAVVDIGFEQAVQRIRGPEGSSVALFVKNAAGGEPTEIIVFRRRIRP